MTAEQWGAIAGSICIIMAWSYLFKESDVYYFAEHLFVGLTVARGLTYTFENQLKPLILKDIAEKGQWSLLIPVVIGLLIYCWFFKGLRWVARITMGFWIGYGAGYTLAFSPPVYLKQVFDTFTPFIKDGRFNFEGVLYFLVVITALMYFLFTVKKESGVLKYGSMFGRYALMVAFGSAYGSITMAYLSLVIGKLQVIFKDALHLVK
ncbi:MAG: hypothetical protein IMW97_03385 [Firmicutes bacterium]|nr:hypothetical protein [Candidatus Fermentithermobacillaceae bacterium]